MKPCAGNVGTQITVRLRLLCPCHGAGGIKRHLLDYIVCLATFFLTYLLPYLSVPLRIDPLRFQSECPKRRLNLALVFCVAVHFLWFVNVCFCRVRFSFFHTGMKPRDWLGEMSLKWPLLCRVGRKTTTDTHTHTHPFNGPFSGTTQVSRYQKDKTNLDFTEARDSEWQWHQLGRMQVCTALQTDNHASTLPLSFLQAGCPSCRPTNSVKALKAKNHNSVNK